MNIGERIANERERLGLKLEELSDIIGFNNYQTLSSIEKGQRQVKISELEVISKALGLNISYFLELQEKIEAKVLWRKCSDKKECAKYENELKELCSNYKKLCGLINHKYEKFVSPSQKELQRDIYNNDSEFAVQLAKSYRKSLDLGRYPGNNLVNVLQEKNILIFYRDLEDKGSAASLVGDFGAAILLNKNNTTLRRTFDIAHELFHLITWNVYDPNEIYDDEIRGKSNVEKYADKFAAALLLPEESLRNEIIKRKKITIVDIIDMAYIFRVSIQTLTFRLQNTEIFSGEDMEVIRNKYDLAHLNKKIMEIIKEDIPELPEIYVANTLKAYNENKISKLKLADYLKVKFSGLNSLLNKYSFPNIEDFECGNITC